MRTEPAVIIAGIVALVAMLVEFGVPISQGQSVAIENVLKIVVPLAIAAIATRQAVFAPSTVEKIETEAATTGRVTPNLTPPVG